MYVIPWIILGLLTGVMAKRMILDRRGGSWSSSIILGIMGALLGGAIHRLAQMGNIQLVIFDFIISDMYFAILGAFIAILLYGLLLFSNL
jgi:uncharacterized membrane protein YeaQ/YmgE (transglycosylase-associated protein family)